jgi:hypothetical protein
MANLTFGLSQGPANFNGSRNPENLITLDGAPAGAIVAQIASPLR